ncbi:MAG: tryptophan 7-halogenase, partial [Acidobacteriota bacterium]|nr:tryptophan 7-halogenase [Acidobacteriota bacterium]
ATGQWGRLSRTVRLKLTDPSRPPRSFYPGSGGARRDEGIDEGATLLFWTRHAKSWFWFIPLPDDVVSVGVVGPLEHLLANRTSDPRTVFDEELDNCPALQERLANAEQILEVHAVRDFSYLSTRIAGDGWVLAGDAFGFLDPIYSTGVYLALKSAELAADSILSAFRENDFSAARLGSHGDAYVAGMEALRRLVYAYYDANFSFHEFLERFPDCREDLVNFLIGNVFDRPVDRLFESMGEMCELPEARRLQVLEERG